MVGLCPDLVTLQAFGTDGEKALSDGFQLQFVNARHLLCFIHVRDCIIRKLRDLGISGTASKPFLYDIFGKQEGTHRYSALVDCDPQEFDKQLLELREDWNNRESTIRSSSYPEFFNWFLKYQSEKMKACMLKSHRQSAGLGDPPKEYTNNPN